MPPKKNIPTELKANAIEVLSCLKAPYLDAVFRERASEDEAMAAVVALAKAEVMKSSVPAIPVPPEIKPDAVEAYRAHVERAAEGAESEVLTVLLAVPEARVLRAKEGLTEAELDLANLNADEERLAEVSALEGRRTDDPDELRREVKKRERQILGLVLAEGAVAFRAWSLYEGLNVRASAGTWLATVLLSIASTVASIYLATKVRAALDDGASTRLRRVGLATTIVAGAAWALGIATIRAVGELPLDELSSTVEAVASSAVFIVSIILGAVVSLAVAEYIDEWKHLKEELRDLLRDKAVRVEEAAQLARRRQLLEEKIKHLIEIVEAPSRFREIYVLGLEVAKKNAADRNEEIRRIVAEARSAYRFLATLTPAMRDAVRASLFEIRDVSTKTVGLGLLGVVSFLVLGMSACTEPVSVPKSMTVICDGTGRSEACSTDFLERGFVSFAKANREPRSTFLVVTTAESLADTKVALRLEVPERSRERRGDHEAWIRASLPVVGAVEIPRDDQRHKSVNRSNELAALIVASREAAATKNTTTLVLAMDGWNIGEGVNLERESPRGAEMVKKLRGVDVSRFESVVGCGFDHVGHSARLVALRDAAWREVFPDAPFLTSCLSVFPAVPVGLRPRN